MAATPLTRLTEANLGSVLISLMVHECVAAGRPPLSPEHGVTKAGAA
ncbi:MAG: hypothetical protein LBI84_02490 [Propionibacteriaceae bacterium]|jgi:hypothetical protein|nr:hypothetical protein [Propionibacteriaceae bacterium]